MKVVARSRNSAVKAIDDYIAKTGLGTQWERPQELTIKPFKAKRSCEQNALMHVLWREVANHVGKDEETIKQIFKMQYGPEEIVDIDGRAYRTMKSTLDYDWSESSDMIDRIYAQGIDWGVEFTER